MRFKYLQVNENPDQFLIDRVDSSKSTYRPGNNPAITRSFNWFYEYKKSI